MKFVEIKEKELWNSWVGARHFSQFLQAWQWGEFHERIGRKVWRLAMDANQPQSFDGAKRECDPSHEGRTPPKDMRSVAETIARKRPKERGAISELARKIPLSPLPAQTDPFKKGENMVLAAQVIKYDLPFGQSYLYCPRGPIENARCENQNEKLWNLFFEKIEELAEDKGSMFFRLEPITTNAKCENQNEKSWNRFFNLRRVKAAQPEKEWILDLMKTGEELLQDMHQKTRYNIRLAEKKGVKIKVDEGKEYFNDFWKLISETYGRKNIRTHAEKYYKNILDIGSEVKLWVAEFEGKIIAANIMSYFGDTVSYMHGGSDYNSRNLMSPYLLHWMTIKNARENGFRYYNFGGISDVWEGISKFKTGFGGFEMNYPGTYDFIAKNGLYETYKALKRINRFIW